MTRLILGMTSVLAREGVRRILGDFSDFDVVGVAESPEEIFVYALRPDADVVLLDVTRQLDGMHVAEEMTRSGAPGRAVIFAEGSYPHDAQEIFKAGVFGVLGLSATPAAIVEAIHAASMRRPYIDDGICEKIFHSCLATCRSHYGLSPREFEVFRLLAMGMRNTDVATHLSLSVKTISTHKRRIIDRLLLKSDAELVLFAVSNHLI